MLENTPGVVGVIEHPTHIVVVMKNDYWMGSSGHIPFYFGKKPIALFNNARAAREGRMTYEEYVHHIYIDFKDVPGWVQEILKERKMRPRSIPVDIGVVVNVGGFDMTTLYLYNGEEVVELKGAITANPWASHVEKAIAEGGEVTLPRPECMIFEVHHFQGKAGCRLYAHPAGVIKVLMEPNELTATQKAVLLATRIFKSSYGTIKDYRYHEMGERYNISFDDWTEAKSSLIQTAHLNKRGAITTKGLNVVRGMNYRELGDLFKREEEQDE